MRTLKHLLENNREWSRKVREEDPDFFKKLAKQQTPPYLWIGCSDSRVPANQIVGLLPGQVFVHRNVANVVENTDLNCLSVIQYAVEVLEVQDIIVCGHYGCGGVHAAMEGTQFGLADNWLRHIKDVYHQNNLGEVTPPEGKTKADLLCELNVAAQVQNVCRTTIVQNAWHRGHQLTVHGWIYELSEGLLTDLDVCAASPKDLDEIYRMKAHGG